MKVHRTSAGSRRPTDLHVLRSLETDLRVKHVKRGTTYRFHFQVIGKHCHRLDHVLDEDASLAVVCGFPERFNVEVGQDCRDLFESGL